MGSFSTAEGSGRRGERSWCAAGRRATSRVSQQRRPGPKKEGAASGSHEGLASGRNSRRGLSCPCRRAACGPGGAWRRRPRAEVERPRSFPVALPVFVLTFPHRTVFGAPPLRPSAQVCPPNSTHFGGLCTGEADAGGVALGLGVRRVVGAE